MSENLDLALELTFKAQGNIAADALVHFARDNGWRGASLVGTTAQEAAFAKACQKYTVAQVQPATEALPHNNLLVKILAKRREGQNAKYVILLTPDGIIKEQDRQAIVNLSSWLHYFGHALYEGRPNEVKTQAPNFVLANIHAPYNLYLFVSLLTKKVSLTNLSEQIQRIEWIDTREQLTVPKDNQLTLADNGPLSGSVRVLRIMLYRPEDDIPKTKF